MAERPDAAAEGEAAAPPLRLRSAPPTPRRRDWLRLPPDWWKGVVLTAIWAFVAGIAAASALLLDRQSFHPVDQTVLTLDWLAFAFVVVLAALDVLFRSLTYKSTFSVQSGALDVVLLSLGYRFVSAGSDSIIALNRALNPFVPMSEWIQTVVLIALVTATASCYSGFAMRYRNVLKEKLHVMCGDGDDNQRALVHLLVQHVHPKLWGLFNREVEQGVSELDEINKIVVRENPGAESLRKADTNLGFSWRVVYVAELAFLGWLSLLVNSLHLVATK